MMYRYKRNIHSLLQNSKEWPAWRGRECTTGKIKNKKQNKTKKRSMAGIGGKGDIDRNLFTLWDFLRGSLSGRHLFLSLFLFSFDVEGGWFGGQGGGGWALFFSV